MMNRVLGIFLILSSVLLSSCNYKVGSTDKLTKQDYANDIAKYVTIEENIYKNGGRDNEGVYHFEERHEGYILDNDTEYTLDNVVVEFAVDEQLRGRSYMAEYKDHVATLEFNYIKAKEIKKITKKDIVKALNLNLNEYSITVRSFKIRKIRSTALGI